MTGARKDLMTAADECFTAIRELSQAATAPGMLSLQLGDVCYKAIEQIRIIREYRPVSDIPELQSLARRLESINELRRMMELGALELEIKKTCQRVFQELP